jgi:hypothetical protein
VSTLGFAHPAAASGKETRMSGSTALDDLDQ